MTPYQERLQAALDACRQAVKDGVPPEKLTEIGYEAAWQKWLQQFYESGRR